MATSRYARLGRSDHFRLTDDPGSDPFRLEEDLVVIVGPLQFGVFGVLRTDRTVVSVRQRNTKLATSCTVAGISIRGKTRREEKERLNERTAKRGVKAQKKRKQQKTVRKYC